MSFMQRLISVVLYGNAAHKQVIHVINMRYIISAILQVYRYLQLLMVCMSASSTTAIIDELSRDHDQKVLSWSEKLKENFQVCNSLFCS